MNKSIPAGAAILLEFIYETETKKTAPDCYRTIYGHNEGKLAKPITSMTLGEIQAAQVGWTKSFKSSATGAYQFMRATLGELIEELKLPKSALFTPDLQDTLGYHLLKRRGYNDFVSGKMSRTEFGKRLAQEWASFPVLADTKGDKRAVTRGQSYYAGDGLNKALVKPEKVELVLDKVLYSYKKPDVPTVNTVPTNIIVDAVDIVPQKIEQSIPVNQIKDVPIVTSVVSLSAGAGVVLLYSQFSSWFTETTCKFVGLFCGG